jgi:hypothetical protein
MKYRAILIDPGNSTQERPVQILTNSRPDVDHWAAGVLSRGVSEKAAVNVYQIEERQIDILTKKGKPV